MAVAPVRPSAALRIAYQRRLEAEIQAMHRSLIYWLSARYKADPPELAQDASPAMILRSAFRKLARRWRKRFDDLAPALARYFAEEVENRSWSTLKSEMRKAGLTVKFQRTRAMNDVLQATVAQNVTLIKSIASQHLDHVEGDVMRAVQAGSDLGTLRDQLVKTYGVTKRRAALIARTQNSMAMAQIQRTQHMELGITHARWLHSSGGKTPRPTHVAFSGQIYDIRKGVVLDPKEGIVWPGTAINCRCVSQPIIPGLERR